MVQYTLTSSALPPSSSLFILSAFLPLLHNMFMWTFPPPHTHTHPPPHTHAPQGVVGTELSLKTALVSLFVEEVLELEGDEKGKHIEHGSLLQGDEGYP